MRAAMAEARRAAAIGEVPIGAVAVVDGRVIAAAHNRREIVQDPLGHAEILLIEQLAVQLARWRLDTATIYVTCEPCIMCAGALLQARVAALFYGCLDPKAGACGSLYNVVDDARLNHRIPTIGGVLAEECGALLSDFFSSLRAKRSSAK